MKGKRTIVIFASALIVAGVFVPYLRVDVSIYLFSLQEEIAVSDAPAYCAVFVILAAIAMVFAVLRSNSIIGLIGAGACLTGSIVMGFLCKHPVLLIKLFMDYIVEMDTLFGSEEIAELAKDVVDIILEHNSDTVEAELAGYLNTSLSLGFFFILLGSIAGCIVFTLGIVSTSVETRGLLNCVKGENVGTGIIMNNGDTIVLGRDSATCNLVLKQDRRISRKHCAVSYRNGKFYVTDYSSNGTYLGTGRKLEKCREFMIGKDENIQLSEDTVFRAQVKPD